VATKTPNLTDLKQYLKKCSPEELVLEIAELYKRFDGVKDYYQVKLSPDSHSDVITKYKKIIGDQFFPTRGLGKAKLSIAKKAITDYKKIAENARDVVDIMLFYVEQGVLFTNEYGDISESFYSSMESVYEDAVELMAKNKIHDIFQKRCLKIVKDTSHIGWGFNDTLDDIYSDAFGEK
jgi:hypothetical protein